MTRALTPARSPRALKCGPCKSRVCSAPSPVSRAETFGAGAGAATDFGLVAHEDHVSVAGALSGRDAGAAPSCRVQQMTWREWLRLRAFFQVMAVYSLTRLATNVSQVYLSFFVTATLGMDKTSLALVPLLLYLVQLSATLSLKPVVARLGRRNAMTLGAALISAACALMLTLDQASSGGIYPAMLLLGAGSAISMVISVSLESDLIGAKHGERRLRLRRLQLRGQARQRRLHCCVAARRQRPSGPQRGEGCLFPRREWARAHGRYCRGDARVLDHLISKASAEPCAAAARGGCPNGVRIATSGRERGPATSLQKIQTL